MSALILGLAACHPKPPPSGAPSDASSTPAAPADPSETPDKQGVTFGEGFQKEEVGAEVTLRWVRQNSAMRIDAPSEGRYKLTFRPFTVFSTVANTVEVSVNGQAAGSFTMNSFNLSNLTPITLETSLHAGSNDVRLHSKGAENRMSDSDDRVVAYGLAVPVTVERIP